jgi:hypothetical protein
MAVQAASVYPGTSSIASSPIIRKSGGAEIPLRPTHRAVGAAGQFTMNGKTMTLSKLGTLIKHNTVNAFGSAI